MTIETRIKERMGIAHFVVAEKYFSRRNAVYRIDATLKDGTDTSFVYKEYDCGDIDEEAAVLARFNGDRVPRILMRGENALCMQHFAGETLMSELEALEPRGETPYAMLGRLVDFLKHFYTLMPGRIYGDVNLRNFIDTDIGVCGVDLEETGEGRPETDIGRMAAFILTYRPAHTAYKQDAIAYLIRLAASKLGIEQAAIETEMQAELRAMKTRRIPHMRG